ncbi:MAG TPA: hypothetical protein PL041_07120 [Melioribacteraceae bacterium]|nr:hypothetical protein [Melioribacteraceae bacterium]
MSEFNFINSLNTINIPNKNYLNVLKIHKNIYYSKNKNFIFVKKHEVKYHGNLYDIIKTKQIGDTVFILCISDKNEDVLEKSFLEHFFADKRNNKNMPLKNIVDKLHIDGYTEKNIDLPTIQNGSKKYPHVFASPLKTVLDIPVPPPKPLI